MSKYVLLCCFFICFSASAFAQSLPKFLGMQRDSTYTFYVNIDQKIHLSPQNSDVSFIELKASNAYVQKINDSLYLIRYNNTFEATKLKLYYKNLPVDIINLKVETMPTPAVILGGNLGPNLTLSTLRNVNKLDIVFPNENGLMNALELFQCRITITEPGKPLTFNTNIGGTLLPAHIAKLLSELKPRSTIRFDEFKIKTAQNYVLDVEGSSVTFIVVE